MTISSFFFLSICLYFGCVLFLSIVLWEEHWKHVNDCTIEDIFFSAVKKENPFSFMSGWIAYEHICNARYIPALNLLMSILIAIVYICNFVDDCKRHDLKNNNKQ